MLGLQRDETLMQSQPDFQIIGPADRFERPELVFAVSRDRNRTIPELPNGFHKVSKCFHAMLCFVILSGLCAVELTPIICDSSLIVPFLGRHRSSMLLLL